jgi:hypothetical protein
MTDCKLIPSSVIIFAVPFFPTMGIMFIFLCFFFLVIPFDVTLQLGKRGNKMIYFLIGQLYAIPIVLDYQGHVGHPEYPKFLIIDAIILAILEYRPVPHFSGPCTGAGRWDAFG